MTKSGSIAFETRAFIGGRYLDMNTSKVFSRVSPVNGQPLPDVYACSPKDVDQAVRSAAAAFAEGRWTGLKPDIRKSILLKFASLLEHYASELAYMDCMSMGKPISECISNDNRLALECIRWYAEAIDKVYGESICHHPNALAMVIREPLGVVGAITPWNFPMENVAWKIAPALAAGNSLVLKPSEQAPYSALFLGKLATEAGIPEGVLNIIPGTGQVAGSALAQHPLIDGIFFTGSSSTGRTIANLSGTGSLKRVGLECGGKSPFIVLNDCPDIGLAAKTLAQNIFYNQGQICSAPSRLIIEKKVHQPMIDALLKLIPSFLPGHPLDPSTRYGAMVSQAHRTEVLTRVKQGVKSGATLVTGGQETCVVDGGAYMLPTILDNVTGEMDITKQEIFGPVLCITTANDWKDAVRKANNTEFGLASAVWTSNISIACSAARELRCGIVHINSYGEDDLSAPFGGYKNSGNGSKDKSLHALNDYSNLKTLWIKH